MATDRQPRDLASATTTLLTAALTEACAHTSDALSGVNTVCSRLGQGLAPWIGADGWHALMQRAVADVAGNSASAPLVVERDGVLGWRRGALNGDAHALFVAVLDASVRVLERFVGAELSATLVEQALAVHDHAARAADRGDVARLHAHPKS